MREVLRMLVLLFVWGCSIYFTKVRPQRGLQPGPSS